MLLRSPWKRSRLKQFCCSNTSGKYWWNRSYVSLYVCSVVSMVNRPAEVNMSSSSSSGSMDLIMYIIITTRSRRCFSFLFDRIDLKFKASNSLLTALNVGVSQLGRHWEEYMLWTNWLVRDIVSAAMPIHSKINDNWPGSFAAVGDVW